MPVYEYQCSACKRIEEAFQKISDPPLAVCPKCKGHLEKIISHSSFHLKGSGWYVTDYGGAKTNTESPDKSQSAPTETTPAAPSAKKKDDSE
ncbi:MAG: zinc ribbon domain-containing protein [Desulfotignum sp.]